MRDGKLTFSGFAMIICLTVFFIYTAGFWTGMWI